MNGEFAVFFLFRFAQKKPDFRTRHSWNSYVQKEQYNTNAYNEVLLFARQIDELDATVLSHLSLNKSARTVHCNHSIVCLPNRLNQKLLCAR